MNTEKKNKVATSQSKKPASKSVKKRDRMSVPYSNHRMETCLWLVKLLQKNPRGLTLKEINREYDRYMKEDKGYPDGPDVFYGFERRTFYNYYHDGAQSLLGVVIECNIKDGFRYYIDGGVDDDPITKWMLESFSTSEALLKSKSIRNRILLEQIPSGGEWLETIMQAMRENRKISFKYQNYNEATPRFIEKGDPYCVKIYHQRWYVVVNEYLTEEKNGLPITEKRVYSLDRLSELTMEEETFKIEENFSAEEFFYHAFAVRVQKDNPPRVIKIKVKSVQVPYIEDLKLHHSQTLLERTDEYSIYTLYCALTVELVMQLLYYGSLIEVLEPNELKEEIMCQVYWMSKAYGVDQDIIDEALEEAEDNDEKVAKGDGDEDAFDIDQDEIRNFRYSIFKAMRDYVNEDGEHPYTEQEAAQMAYSFFTDESLCSGIKNLESPEEIAEFYCQ